MVEDRTHLDVEHLRRVGIRRQVGVEHLADRGADVGHRRRLALERGSFRHRGENLDRGRVDAEVIASRLDGRLRLVSLLLTEEGRLRDHVMHRWCDDDLVILSSEKDTLWRYANSMGVAVSVLPEGGSDDA